jgi:hypothetical protein
MPRGRPKALSLGRATHPSQLALDDLLLDIARTKQKIKSVRELVTVLKWQSKYEDCPYETLRNHVTEAMHWAASRLHRLKLFADDVKSGYDATTGFFDEASFDKAVVAAQARPLRMSADQFKKTLQRLREVVREIAREELLTQKQ